VSRRHRPTSYAVLGVALVAITTASACTGHGALGSTSAAAHPGSTHGSSKPSTGRTSASRPSTSRPTTPASTVTLGAAGLPGMPPPLSPTDVYAADRPGMISAAIAHDPAYVYVPDTNSNDVYVIDQHTMKVVSVFAGGHEPQHVVPSYDLKTLYVTADKPGQGSITPIDPRTGRPGTPIAIDDVYNMYYTPNGQYAIAVQEAYTRLSFYDWHTWQLHDSQTYPSCEGIDHMDFTADGTKLVASCEFSNQLVVIDVATHRLLKTIYLHQSAHGMPQDIKLSPDGKTFYVADMVSNGIYLIDARTFEVIRFQPTGPGAHGLYISRDSKRMFVTNRNGGSITVIDLATGLPAVTWHLPNGGSPDMGNVSADGRVLWLSGRYNNVVYAISTVDGHLIATIAVGSGPHGLCVWPVPGRYSLGHTGILR
jgi:YVTN family beta-propeller protein